MSAVRSSRYEARGKFGEHERCVRVAWGVAESSSSFLNQLLNCDKNSSMCEWVNDKNKTHCI